MIKNYRTLDWKITQTLDRTESGYSWIPPFEFWEKKIYNYGYGYETDYSERDWDAGYSYYHANSNTYEMYDSNYGETISTNGRIITSIDNGEKKERSIYEPNTEV